MEMGTTSIAEERRAAETGRPSPSRFRSDSSQSLARRPSRLRPDSGRRHPDSSAPSRDDGPDLGVVLDAVSLEKVYPFGSVMLNQFPELSLRTASIP